MAKEEVCLLPNMYSWIMREAWREVKQRAAAGEIVTLDDFRSIIAAAGEIVTLDDFRSIIKSKWAEAKQKCFVKH